MVVCTIMVLPVVFSLMMEVVLSLSDSACHISLYNNCEGEAVLCRDSHFRKSNSVTSLS